MCGCAAGFTGSGTDADPCVAGIYFLDPRLYFYTGENRSLTLDLPNPVGTPVDIAVAAPPGVVVTPSPIQLGTGDETAVIWVSIPVNASGTSRSCSNLSSLSGNPSLCG